MPNRSDSSGAVLAREIAAHNAERRREARYPTQDPIELETLPGPSGPIYGTILDVSRSGLRIALRKRIGRGEQVKIKLHRSIIFGEVRYCRSVPDGFHAGVKIQGVVGPPGRDSKHIADDPLSLYAVGKGLSVPEVIEVRDHLARCEACRARLLQHEEMLNPGAKHRGRFGRRARD